MPHAVKQFGIGGTIVYFSNRSHFDYLVKEKLRNREEVMQFAVPYGAPKNHHHVHYAIDYPHQAVFVFDEKPSKKKSIESKESKQSRKWLLGLIREELQELGSWNRSQSAKERTSLAKRYLQIHGLNEFNNAKDLKFLTSKS